MPFGLTNSPAAFKDLMSMIFKPFLDKFVLVFVDDILNYSKSREDHEQHLHLALQLLKSHRLSAKFKKVRLLAQANHILGPCHFAARGFSGSFPD